MSQVMPDQASTYSSTYSSCSAWNGGPYYAVFSGGDTSMPSPPNTNAYLIQQYPTASGCGPNNQFSVQQYYLNGGCFPPSTAVNSTSTTYSGYTCTTSGYSITSYADSACSLKVKAQFTPFPSDCSISNSTYSCVFAARAPPADTTTLRLAVGLGVGLGVGMVIIAGFAYTVFTEKLKISWTSSAHADTPLLSDSL